MRKFNSAKELFQELGETAWTKYVCARRSDGSYISTYDPQATCWCLLGAMLYVYHPDVYHPDVYYPDDDKCVPLVLCIAKEYANRVETRLLTEADNFRFPSTATIITQFNDHEETTFADIQKVLSIVDI